MTSSDEGIPQANDSTDLNNDVTVLNDTFVAASENGLLLSRPGQSSWRSSVEGGWSSASWLIGPQE